MGHLHPFRATSALLGTAALLVAGLHDAPSAGAVCVAAPADAVAWYPAEGDAADIVGTNDGTPTGGLAFAAGQVGQAFVLDGVDDHVVLDATTEALDFGTGDFTAECWIKLDSTATDQTFFQRLTSDSFGPSYFFEFRAPGALRFGVFESVANRNDFVVDATLTTGQWYHVAAVRSGDTSRIYLDGESLGEQTAGSAVHTGTSGQFAIGSTANGTLGFIRFVHGAIDELTLYSRALSGDEIAAIAAAGADGKCVPEPPTIASFFLPKSVVAKFDSQTPAKSRLTAVGSFDTGPGAPDLGGAAQIDVGGVHVTVPGLTARGRRLEFTGDGLEFSVTPNSRGSSRAKFKLRYTGDLTGRVAASGPLDLHFENSAATGGCRVTLSGGKFGLGKVRGALLEPNLSLRSAKATLKGTGNDSLAVVLGLAHGDAIPPTASELTFQFGSGPATTIPAASFTRKGSVDTFNGNASGITKVVVDYAREQISIRAKTLDLGEYQPGGNDVTIVVGLGDEVRAVAVRMARTGSQLRY
mgnify:CR=1 FL=1